MTRVDTFCDTVKMCYKRFFKDCICDARLVKCLGKTIFIDCYLAKDKTEFPHNIVQNDPIKVTFAITVPNDTEADGYLPETITLEAYQRCYATKPENKYLYCDLKKVAFRKTTGNPDKILKTLDRFFAKLHDSMMEDYKNDNLLDFEAELFKKNVVGQ